MLGKYLDDRFLVEEELGEGGMSRVWRARDTVSGKRIAVKVLKSSTADPSMRERFLREAETQAKLKSPHIARIYHFGRDMTLGCLFIVMELVEGDDLAWLVQHGRLPLDLSIAVVDQTLEGLSHTHAAGVIHRDIKPSNIKLSNRNGELCVKLLDFGFVRLQKTERHLTADGMIGGTLTYISPEELEFKDLDHRLDLYSLAAVWFEMLAGVPPFVGRNPQMTAVKHLTETAPRLDELVEVPEEVADLIEWMLQKDPENRPESADHIREYIAAIRQKYHLITPPAQAGATRDPVQAWGLIPM